jgi:hypothetical protein
MVIPKKWNEIMMEIDWGNPMTFVVSPEGDTQKFSTLEQALHWLRTKWPVADHDRDIALDQLDGALHCLTTVAAARKAFISAAKTAGFKPDHLGSATAAAC